MIVVVEGISASGKTTWCEKHGAGHVVPEAGRALQAPDPAKDPAGAAALWSDANARRWRAALAMEGETGLAICDTDPLKLHYAWGLWRIGEAPEDLWRCALKASRESLGEGRIGLADLYLVKTIDPEAARRRRDADPTRSRRNFERHLRLQPPLIAWYQAVAAVLPGRVQFALPDAWTTPADRSQAPGRHDPALFERVVALLPS